MGAGEIFQGEGSGGRGGVKRGGEGREAGIRGEGSGGWGPPCPPPQNKPQQEHRLGTASNKLLSGGGWVLNRFYARATLAQGSVLLDYRYKKNS